MINSAIQKISLIIIIIVMNIDPKIWGTHAWIFMHYVTLGYPEVPDSATKNAAANFFLSLKYLLPCWSCRKNYDAHIARRPLTDEVLSSRQKLIDWLIDLHNDVNISTGKQYVDRHRALEQYMNPANATIDSRIIIIAVAAVLLIVFVVLLRYGCAVPSIG